MSGEKSGMNSDAKADSILIGLLGQRMDHPQNSDRGANVLIIHSKFALRLKAWRVETFTLVEGNQG